MQNNIVFGMSSTVLTVQEREFFKRYQPIGFILFARNIKDKEQLTGLISELKSLIDSEHVLIMVDQEGGRVQRLKPPHFKGAIAAGEYFARANKDIEAAKLLVYDDHYLMGRELVELGINVNCAPVVDLFYADAHKIIGDRSFGDNQKVVTELGRQAMYGLMQAGVMPVLKHIPGHGRAMQDSHHALPIINASLAELESTDFVPFRELAFSPFAMTAHVVVTAIDAENPVTLSRKAIDYIRNQIGFKNIIITDALEMKALAGTLAERTQAAQTAGCDIILHCSGKISEMEEIVPYIRPVADNVQKLLSENWA